jgi:hypothetical protein
MATLLTEINAYKLQRITFKTAHSDSKPTIFGVSYNLVRPCHLTTLLG